MTVSQKKAYLQKVCGSYGLLLRREEGSSVNVLYGGLRCNSWLCPRCRKRKARLFARATLAFFKGSRVSHLTITDSPRLSASESFRTFSRRWNHFRTLLTRGGRRFTYVRVLEEQPGTGRAHYHILTKEYIPRRLLEESLSSAGFGKIYKIHECSDVEAFYYVRKYLVKEWPNENAFQLVIDNNLRLISGSRGFALTKAPSESWEVILKLCNHSYGRSYTKLLILSAASAGARLESWKQSELFDQFSLNFSDSFKGRKIDDLLQALDRSVPRAITEGARFLDDECFQRFIKSQLAIDAPAL